MLTDALGNYKQYSKIFPDYIFGIKFIGYNIRFYKISLSEEYIREIDTNLPNTDLLIFKFPNNNQHRIFHMFYL